MLSRLEAINEMLTAVGEQVILVEIEGAGDYANCSAVLDAEARKVLAKGWFFNTENNVELTPGADGKIAIPSNVLQIDPEDPALKLAQRGAFLYDLSKRTDTFTDPVEVKWVLNFPFEDIPYHVQRQIVATAAQKYQRGFVGSKLLDDFGQAERAEAGADAGDTESDVDDYNILDNPDLAYLRRQTYRRGL